MDIGLVLSGGGTRGAAHIGVIKALEERNITITHIAGASAGAIVGALYANGNTWQEILAFFKRVSIFHYKRYARNKPGFIDTSKFYDDFLPFFAKDDFKTLQKQLFITATNLVTGKEVVFKSGSLIPSILASSAFPGIFTPVIINDSLYIDGGVLNNFPVAPIEELCDTVIGVYVNKLEDISMKSLRYSYQVANRAYQISLDNQSLSKLSKCDVLIAPPTLSHFGMFDWKAMDTIFEIGYNEAVVQLQKLVY